MMTHMWQVRMEERITELERRLAALEHTRAESTGTGEPEPDAESAGTGSPDGESTGTGETDADSTGTGTP